MGVPEFLRQLQRLLHARPGLLWIPQIPQRQRQIDEILTLWVESSVEGGQRLVLGVVERLALLERPPGADKLAAQQAGVSFGQVRFDERSGIKHLLRELQALLR